VAATGKNWIDGLRGLGLRLRGAWRKPVSGRTAAALGNDAVMALILETGRLYGASLVHGHGGWSRGVAGEWPVAAVEVLPETPPPDALAAPLTASLVQARAALRADAVVLGLPTSLLLLRILRMPALTREELSEAVALQMDKLSPFPGDELSIGWEVLAEDAEQVTIFAAAAPDRHMQVLDQARTAAGLRVVRMDVALLAWWRMLREQKLLPAGEGRQAVLIAQGGEWDLLVLDRGLPVVARGLGCPVEDGDLARELTLSLFQAEMEAGTLPLQEVIVVSATAPTASVLGPIRTAVPAAVRCVPAPADGAAAEGLCLRTMEGATLDLTPGTWRHREQAAVAHRRLVLGLSAAAGIWVALLAALVLGPFVTDQLAKLQNRRLAEIATDYQQVDNMRKRVGLIDRYKERSGSLLESLRTICAVQPEGVDLSEVTYEREKSCKLKGEAAIPALVYTFKERIETNAPFSACKLGAVSSVPGSQKQRFELEAILGEASR
jgi:hypothetical protein